MAAYKPKLSDTDKFLCREFFAGKSFSVLARDYAIVHHCSRGEANEAVYNALANYAFDYDFKFS